MTSVLPQLPPGTVPTIFHFVWVGSPPPGWVLDRWDYWQDFCRYHSISAEFRLWTDDDVEDLLPLSSRLRPSCSHPVLFSDFVRIEAVARYGGIYVDSDFWPIRPLGPILDRPRAWSTAMWNTSRKLPDGSFPRGEVANALFGFSPWHPFLGLVWARCVQRLPRTYKRLVTYAGPPVWTAVDAENPGMIDVLSPDWFYPTEAKEKDLRGWTPDSIRDSFPDAIMWHEFEQSWTPDYAGRLDWRPRMAT